VYFIRAEPIFGDPYYNFSDSVTNVIVWSVVEVCFSIIAANLPYVPLHRSYILLGVAPEILLTISDSRLLAPLFKKGQGLRSLLHYGSKPSYGDASNENALPDLQLKQLQTASTARLHDRSPSPSESV